MWWLYIPLVVIGLLLLLVLALVLLGRYKNGALLRPVIARLSRIGFMRRFFTRVSTAAIERQNPELASALKKINPVASNPNPQAVQKAMSRLTPAERRAYMEAAGEQGTVPDSANRQMRRQAERMQQQARGATATARCRASRAAGMSTCASPCTPLHTTRSPSGVNVVIEQLTLSEPTVPVTANPNSSKCRRSPA